VTFKTSGLPSSCVPYSSQKLNLSLFHLPIIADSIEYCAETRTSHHNRFFVQFWLRPQFTALQVAHIFLISCYCLPCCTANFSRRNRCSTFTSLRMFITCISCFFKLFNSPVDTVARSAEEQTISDPLYDDILLLHLSS
jgi:hypothetical protein